MKFVIVIASAMALLTSSTMGYQLKSQDKHACDFLDETGEEVSTSLIDNENTKPIELSNVEVRRNWENISGNSIQSIQTYI